MKSLTDPKATIDDTEIDLRDTVVTKDEITIVHEPIEALMPDVTSGLHETTWTKAVFLSVAAVAVVAAYIGVPIVVGAQVTSNNVAVAVAFAMLLILGGAAIITGILRGTVPATLPHPHDLITLNTSDLEDETAA